MRFFARQRSRRIFQLTQEQLEASPAPRLIRLYVAQAVRAKAAEFGFGIPAGARFTWRDCQKEAAVASGTMPDWFQRGLHLRGPDGLEQIPMWLRVDGAYYACDGPPAGMLPGLLWMLDFLVVALEDGADQPAPKRFIEFPELGSGRYAEIELGMAQDNTIRFTVIGVREGPPGKKPW